MDAFPLSSPNGVIYAWACGRCRHTGSAPSKFVDLNDDDVALFAEDSRQNAARCCSCRGCGTYVSLRERFSETGELCTACWPAEKARHAEASAKYEVIEAAKEEARVKSLKKSKDELAAMALLRTIEDLSEELYCAGWMTGIEHELWGDIYDRRSELADRASYSAESRKSLIDLSQRAGGWWYWDREIDTQLFTTFDEMRSRYKEYWQENRQETP